MDNGGRILVVEDDERRLEQFRSELEGREVDYVSSITDGRAQLDSQSYALIFLDHDLEFGERVYIDPDEPGTGLALARYMSKKPALRSIPVVVHSYNWFGGNRILRMLDSAVYVPFGIYPIAELAALFVDAGLHPDLSNAMGLGVYTPPGDSTR